MIDSFPIVPGQIRILWFAIPLGVLVVAAFIALVYSLSSARTARFDVSPAGLQLRGDFYGRLIAPNALRLADARPVDLQTDGTLAPRLRLLGTALPGYRAGWFRLSDGERALLYVTDPKRVLYVPTTNGYAVMVSVADPAAMLASMKRQGWQ
jgi:Bacterial PH domain